MAEKRRGRKREIRENQSTFKPGAVQALDFYAAWRFRCAFTGISLRREAAADPYGTLLRLILPEDPTQLPPGSAIPACLDAIYAFEQGHLTLGLRYEFIVAMDVISPEFLETLYPVGRLAVPGDDAFRPDAASLVAHRAGMLDHRFRGAI